MIKHLTLLFLLLAPFCAADPSPAQLELLPGYRAAGGTHMAGLRIRLEPGWKTYWRSPGITGYPPNFDLSGSSNIKGMEIIWPTPTLIESFGEVIVGYEREVVLPLRLVLIDGARPAHLALRLDMGVCRDICLPLQAGVEVRLPPQTGGRDTAIDQALGRRPAAGQGVVHCELSSSGRGLSITLSAPTAGVQNPHAVVEYPGLAMRQTGSRIAGGRITATAQSYGMAAIARDQMRLTLIGRGGRAVEYRGCD